MSQDPWQKMQQSLMSWSEETEQEKCLLTIKYNDQANDEYARAISFLLSTTVRQ